jgi:putative RNA 2'-phosphotransferase
MDKIKISKQLSYVLRHRPDSIGLTLDSDGWVAIDTLLQAFAQRGTRITRTQLDTVVATNDKQRFLVDGERIRASQGHSIPVDLGLRPVAPPAELYHGTARRNLAAIMIEGLVKGRRQHVHLSADVATAQNVGARYDARPVILTIDAAAMHAAGLPFYLSDNNVWLADLVPAEFLSH